MAKHNDDKKRKQAEERERQKQSEAKNKAAQAPMAEAARKSPAGTTKMKFFVDTPFNDVIYTKGGIYDIENRMVDKWLKRGAVIVTAEELSRPSDDQIVDDDEKTEQDQTDESDLDNGTAD